MAGKAIVNLGSRPDEARAQVESLNTEVLADYGPSLLVRGEDEDLLGLRAQGLRVRFLEKAPTIKIGGFELHTQGPQLAGAELALAGPGAEMGRRGWVVDLAGPLHPDWKARVEDLGGVWRERLGDDHYLLSLDADRVAALKALEFVDGVLPYYPALKVSPELLTNESQATLAQVPGLVPLGLPGAPPPEPEIDLRKLTVRPTPMVPEANASLLLFDDADPDQVAEKVESLGVAVVQRNPDALLVRISSDQVPEVAAIPEVRRVESYAPPKLANNVATGLLSVDLVQNQFGLDGAGQIVAVADTGLDTGDLNNLLADFQGRVIALVPLGRPGDASDPDGHGTHVAGSVLGDGANSNGTIRGTAPAAQLIFQSLLDFQGGLGGLANIDLGLDLFGPAMALGARLHSNSWGSDTNGGYTTECRQTDRFIFANREFLAIFAAGNEAPRRVGSPGAAKNVLTIGASESLRALPASVAFPPSPQFPQGASLNGVAGEADDDREIASFSSPGPVGTAGNERQKPDVVAPGTWILSTRSSAAVADTGPDGIGASPSLPNGTGDEDGVLTHGEAVGLGLPGGPILGGGDATAPALPAGAAPDAAESYMYQSGTSMATPLTAGCCALVRQFLIDRLGHVPSGALIKGIVINGAMDVGIGIPRPLQGWGRVNLDRALQPPGGLHFDDSVEHAVATGEIREFHLEVAVAGVPLVVTLVWRDPEGTKIQNRLHLRVISLTSGAEFAAESIEAIRNNVQRVTLNDLDPGNYRVEVEGVNISMPVPEFAPAHRQDFALVVAGASQFSA
ncbi:MAG: S8 family serine peptidase [Acidobacteriota bacterium]